MARGRKPKTETEIEEVVEEVAEQPTEIIDDMGGVVDVSVTTVDEAAETETVDEVKEETAVKEVVEEVAEKVVEDKPKRQRRSRHEDKTETIDETTSDEPAKTEFNPDNELPKDVIRQTIKLHNFTTIYRDEALAYPLIKVYGDATLIDVISSKVLRVRAMFNGRPIIGYIKRGSVR